MNGQAHQSFWYLSCEVVALLDAAAEHGGRTSRNRLRFLAASNNLPLRQLTVGTWRVTRDA